MKTAIVWFRSNLRLHDNPVINQACDACDNVVCVYIFDEIHHTEEFGLTSLGPFRRHFIMQSLLDLDAELRKRGNQLIIVHGNAQQRLQKIASQYQDVTLYTQRMPGWYEQQQEASVENLFPTVFTAVNTLIDIKALPFALSKLPTSFTAFRKKVERDLTVQTMTPAPSAIACTVPSDEETDVTIEKKPACHPHAVLNFHGGATAALNRVDDYIWQSNSLAHYKQTRNHLTGANSSSKFSAWLAAGCLSPQRIFNQVKRYEHEVVANESTYWLVFELLWRDFFYFSALKHGADLFKAGGIKRIDYRGSKDTTLFRKWCDGETGEPFVDANMRELKQSGFMSNRGRQNVASYLIHELGLDWRLGARWFEHWLIDYDAASNYGNWNYLAGNGHDPRGRRHFNIQKQAAMYDPDGQYQRNWLSQ